MSHRALRATDRRKGKVRKPEQEQSTGAGHPLAGLFHDRRHPNGSASRAK